MLIPSSITPLIKGREQKDLGGNALAESSRSDSNPDRRHAPSGPVHSDSGEEAKPQETQTSRLIDRSPISSATQAALLALLSEPFDEDGSSFAEIVEAATLEQSTATDREINVEDEDSPDIG